MENIGNGGEFLAYFEFGFDAVDLGGLDQAWRVDPGQPAFVVRQNIAELTANATRASRRS